MKFMFAVVKYVQNETKKLQEYLLQGNVFYLSFKF